MAAPANLSFEAAGATPGAAASWTLVSVATADEAAGFTPAPERGAEDFERGWSSNDNDPNVTTPCMFDTAALPGGQNVEDFESYWSSNELYTNELGSVDGADFLPGPGVRLVEDFEDDWNADILVFLTQALFDTGSQGLEDFENHWNNAVAPTYDGATFQYDVGGSRQAVEDFEKDYPAEWPDL
jgi:hypothetical protein